MFDIRQGIRLGNDVFIVSREYVQGLRKNERRFFRPAVMNPSIVDAKLNDAYYAFYPYTDGLPFIASETELEKQVPQYFKEHLLPAKTVLKGRKTLTRQTELNWWDLLWPRTWQKERNPKIVSKYFGGRRSFAFDGAGEFVVVVGNAWLLRKGAVGDMKVEITDEELYLSVLAYLSSATAYHLLEYVSVQVSGGQLDLSNRYVGELPVPNVATLAFADLSELIQVGTRISRGKIDRWEDVDELVVSILNR